LKNEGSKVPSKKEIENVFNQHQEDKNMKNVLPKGLNSPNQFQQKKDK
jgi:hypothetical protein